VKRGPSKITKETKAQPAEHVETRPLTAITPYPQNARTHTDQQIELLANLMLRYGVDQPIVVDEAGVILKGHGRRLAAIKAGFKTFPVVVQRGLSDDDKRALRIADNQVALLAGWDQRLMQLELGELKLAGFDLPLLGFGDAELASFLDANPGLTDPDEVPEAPAPAVAVSRPGDVWLLGRHRLACGDALSETDVKRLLDGAQIHLANCDPPYGISIVKATADGGSKPFGSIGGVRNSTDRKHIGNYARGRGHGLGQSGFGRVPVNAAKAIIPTGVYAEVIGDDSTDTAIAAYKMLINLAVETIVLWGGNYYANALPPSRCWFAWDKEVSGNFADMELAWTNCDQVARLFRHQWNGLMKASERGERRVHPTQKPVALAEWVINTAAPKAQTVLDLFIGSGSTLIASERQNRQHFGMEMAPAYVDVAVLRWQNFTGEQATLDGGHGQTFAQVAAERTGQREQQPAEAAVPA
jgi:hypothetical protein